MPELFRQLFVNPGMLGAAALVGVPIIIYLINRQRYQRRRWAAMEFLLRAMRRNRRRIQLQNLLLLLVRCAIVLLLVLVAARPVSRLSVLTLAPEESQNWILAVDTSYSMGYQEDSRTLFEQARESILQMLDGLFKPGDQVALVTLEARPRIVLPPTRLTPEGKKSLRREVETLRLTSGAVDLGASLALLDEVCAKLAGPTGGPLPKRLVFFSDLQRKDWLGDDGPRVAGVPQFLEKIQKEGGAFAFARLSAREERSNLCVSELSIHPTLIARDVWVELRATVRAFGEEDFSNIELTLRVDQDPDDRTQEPQVGQVIRVPRGESVNRSLAYKFPSAGYHTAVAEVRSDGLVIDNRRFLALRVEDTVRVLLVDGSPSADPTERSTFHLEVALEPADDDLGAAQGRFTPFETRYATPDQVPGLDLKDHSVVVLSNVPELPAAAADALERYVRAGGAAIVFLGPDVRPEWYNSRLRSQDPPFLPVPLVAPRGDDRFPVNLEAADPAHPLVQYFGERREMTHFERPIISFYRYWTVGPPSPGLGVRTAFRFTDADRSPAVFDNAYGDGRVVWVTSTADLTWNELPNWPDYVIFLHEAMSYLVKVGLDSSNLAAGAPFRKIFPASSYASDVSLTGPESLPGHTERVRSVRKVLRSLPLPEGASGRPDAEAEFELTHDETDAPGLYRLDLRRPGQQAGDTVEYFSSNVDTAESDLRSMRDEDFRAHFEGLKYERFDASARLQEARDKSEMSRGREHWWWLALGVLSLLFLETILGWLFGRRTR